MKRAIAVCVLPVLLLGTTQTFAEPFLLAPGQCTPEPAVCLPEPDAVKTATMLRELTTLREEATLLRASIAAKDQQITGLTAALVEAKAEILFRERESALKDEIIALRKELNDEYTALLVQARATIAQDQAMLAKLGDRIEALERRAFWQAILGPLGLVIGVFAGGFGR